VTGFIDAREASLSLTLTPRRALKVPWMTLPRVIRDRVH